MGTAVVRSGTDSWVNSARPSLNYGSTTLLRLKAFSAYSFIYFANPVPRGANVSSAKLRLIQYGAASGTRTITARRVAASWKESKITWNNQPTVTGTGVAVTKAGTPHDTVWEFDVTADVQAFADGSPNYGWRIVTDDTTMRSIKGFVAPGVRPTLEVSWSDAPQIPTTLNPDGGVVSVPQPTLSFDYTDNSGSTSLAAVRVQVDPAMNEVTPAYDPGWTSWTQTTYPLSTTGYAGLADGATTYWRVNVRDGAGLESGWSDWATFTRDAKGTLTIDNPAADPNDFVSEPTPPILWTFTGETQTHYQVRIADAARPATPLYDSGKVKSTETSHTVPSGVIKKDGNAYVLTVRVWDSKLRQATPGDPVYTEATRTFTYEYDATIDGPDMLSAAQVGASPWVSLVWTRLTAPDGWTIIRDGVTIASGLEADEVSLGGTSYGWRDWTADPNRQHTYRVAAVVGGKASKGGPQAIVTIPSKGIWIGDPDREIEAVLWGQDAGSFTYGEDAAIYTPIGAKAAIRVVTGMRGLEGSISGVIIDAMDYSATDVEAALLDIKANPAGTYRLALGDINIPVVLGNVTMAPSPDTAPDEFLKDVTMEFWQSGEIPFEARL